MFQYSRKSLFQLNKTITMTKRFSSDIAQFRKQISEAKDILVITGAGMSAESGIPTFRGAGGWWRKYKSENLASPHAFKSNPSLVWEFYNYRREVAFSASPNKGHIALARYEELCEKNNRKLTVLTQNVDGLHTAAGSKNVIELHGCLRKVMCTKCKCVEEDVNHPICEALKERGDPKLEKDLPLIDVNDLPKCKSCNGLLRPYIVWFGENLDQNILDTARSLVENCDFCLVIGTSSVVYPAAMFAPLAAERGVPIAEFNINAVPADDSFSFHFSGECGKTLPDALGVSV